MIHRFIPAAAVAAAALLATPAVAQEVSAAGRSQAVYYADLNLGSASGVAALDDRIARAARFVCGSAGRAPVRDMTAANDCATQARHAAASQRDALIASASRSAGNLQTAR